MLKLFKEIARNCPKIEKLCIDVEPEDLDGLEELFLNCTQLKEVNLSTFNEGMIICDELLEILMNFSPKTLYKFSYCEEWNFSVNGLQTFFENWRSRIPIEFNTCFDRSMFYTEEHIAVLKKYLDEGVISKETTYLTDVLM